MSRVWGQQQILIWFFKEWKGRGREVIGNTLAACCVWLNAAGPNPRPFQASFSFFGGLESDITMDWSTTGAIQTSSKAIFIKQKKIPQKD